MTVSNRAIFLLCGVIVICTIAIVAVVMFQSNTTAEQSYQQCVTEAGGYQSSDVDDKIAIRDMCAGYLP